MRCVCALVVGLLVSASPGAWPQTSQTAKVDVLDVHRLPLGDGRVSGGPARGSVMACNTAFRQGGAQHAGAWIHGDTWDLTEKIAVQGRVSWPDAQFAITTGDRDRLVTRILRGNGLPVDTLTGQFPVARNDPAFLIDRNPNPIAARDVVLTLPRDPAPAAAPSCVPMGMIGIALNGVAIYNALDDAGRDAVAHEVQDLCGGHPQMRGEYHYHGPSACLPDQTASERLIGYAIDGYGIFSLYDANGRELTNADLDACHGRESVVDWDGRRVRAYHYVLTREYPYTVGCFHGSPVRGGRGGRGGPDAIAAQTPTPVPSDWTGMLRVGVMAIGGETTGIVLETAKEKFEILPATDAVRADLKKLDGQKVTVHGTLARRPGVEVKERVIITVTRVAKAR